MDAPGNLPVLLGVYLIDANLNTCRNSINPARRILETEANLVLRARTGDSAAWEALVRAHQQAAFRFAYLILGDPAEAEDAVQDALIRAYHALHRFDASRPLRPWLLKITANQARNRRRSLGRYLFALQKLVKHEPQTQKLVETASIKKIESQNLWEVVQCMELNDQQVVYLRFFLDLTVEETAQALGVATGTVKSRLHRALIRLRVLIEKDYPWLREMLE